MHALSSRAAFAIRLSQVEVGGEYQVVNTEILRPGFCHRITFDGSKSLRGIFAPQLAAYIESILVDVDRDHKLEARPDAVVRCDGVAMHYLRILVSLSMDGLRRISLRFEQFTGAITRAFRNHFQITRSVETTCSDLALDIVEHTARPISDIGMTAQHCTISDPHREILQERIDRIDARIEQQRFQLKMLHAYARQFREDAPLRDALGHDAIAARYLDGLTE